MKSEIRLLIVLVIVCVYSFTANAQVVAVVPDSQLVKKGDTVTVRIQAENVTGLKVYSIKVAYNKSLLKCIAVEKLDFLSGPFSTFFITKIDSLNGKVQCDEAILGTGSSTGSGGLFQMKFIGLVAGVSPIDFISLDLRDLSNQQLTYSSANGTVQVQDPSGVERIGAIGTSFEVFPNFPNPFNPSTTIRFSMPVSDLVSVQVFTILGEKVEDLLQDYLNAGTYTISFNGSSLPSGIYVCRISTRNFSKSIKMNLIK